MSRQNRNQVRERKTEEKRDVANNNERYSRQHRGESRNDQPRMNQSRVNGLDRNRLNDLYERSSM